PFARCLILKDECSERKGECEVTGPLCRGRGPMRRPLGPALTVDLPKDHVYWKYGWRRVCPLRCVTRAGPPSAALQRPSSRIAGLQVDCAKPFPRLSEAEDLFRQPRPTCSSAAPGRGRTSRPGPW